ncbi:MAG: ABC-2 transporter permease [Clostridia bacterium]|nr:ABC-2 transporter permease [Clostridia bacterium]
MRDILLKEIRLSASPLAFLFTAFGLMFFVPGYPILCGAFFVTLGLFHSFQAAREGNDIVFSALLPIAKRDVVKGRYLFVCLIEGCGMLLMAIASAVRMTALADSAVYRANALMTANPFALGMACVIFGMFNMIFVGGFFKTAYKLGRPFVTYIVVAFLTIGIAEALHHFEALASLNAFGREHLGLQAATLTAGLMAFALLTLLSYNRACYHFERTDL